MPKQVWVTKDDATFETEKEALLYELVAEYRQKIYDITSQYFTPERMLLHADTIRDLLDEYLIKRAELQK